MTRQLFLLTLVVLLIPRNAAGQIHQQRGSVLGGLAGAVTGAAIGEHNDNPLAGAIIGGAVGLMSGAAIGNARDREIAQSRAYYQHQQLQTIARAVSPQDVVAMTQNGLSDAVIINHIQTNGVQQELQVADVIALHQQGVSEPVISAMQRIRTSPPVVSAPAQVYQTLPPAVIVDHYAAPRYFYGGPRQFYPPRHFRHRPGTSFHFSFGR
jgi:hypothetical protein